MKKTAGFSFKESFTEEEILEMEQRFIDKYYSGDGKHPIRTLFGLFKGHYRRLFLSSVFFMIKTLVVLFKPLVYANILDTLATPGISPEHFFKILIIDISLVLVLAGINIPSAMLYTKFQSIASRSVEAGLRGAVVKKLQKLTMKFDTEMQSGRIQSKIIRDVDNIHTMFDQVFGAALDVVVNLTYITIVVITKGDWSVVSFFILSVPSAVLISRLFLKKFRKKNKDFRKEMEDTSSQVVDMIEMIPVTRAHGLEHVEVEKMNNRVTKLALKGHDLDKYGVIFHGVNFVTIQVFSIACLAFTAFLAFNGKLSVGDVSLYHSYFFNFITYINVILNLIPIISSGSEAITSVGEILGAEDVEENEGKECVPAVEGEFLFKNVVFGYEKDKPVLKGLDLHVPAGQTVALVGESGAGKTTVLNMITGFYMPDSGTLQIDGKNIEDIDLTSYRQHIALVPQASMLFSGTIRENIVYGLNREVSDEELSEVLEAACLTSVIAKLPDGVDTVVGEKGSTLSGGQRQRVSIARAIIRKPKVIILDEATSALDTVSEKKIQTAMDNLTEDRTTFIVAHRLSTIKNADKIVVMENGKCVESGTFDELMAQKGAFYKLNKSQV